MFCRNLNKYDQFMALGSSGRGSEAQIQEVRKLNKITWRVGG